MSDLFRLENDGGSKSRQNERGVRSGAECQKCDNVQDDCLSNPVLRADSEGGGVPSFFPCLSMDNVNAQFRRARELLIMWHFSIHKGRIGSTYVLINRKDEPSVMRIMPSKSRSRYFDDGRMYISRKIMKRLGKYNKVPGLMETLTYDPKKVGKQTAWQRFGKDTRRFLNAVNQYRKRRGWRRLHYLWVVEVQPDTGYPHVHIFFPNLKWLAPLSIINGNWRHGRANIGSPKKIEVNCAGYISKYLRKMHGWSDLHLALLWSGKCRMYGFSRGFSAKVGKKESEWQRWHVIRTSNIEHLIESLEDGGYMIERSDSGRNRAA